MGSPRNGGPGATDLDGSGQTLPRRDDSRPEPLHSVFPDWLVDLTAADRGQPVDGWAEFPLCRSLDRGRRG